ncbi:MAG: DUF2155 domain-containing protein [Rhodospirillales bacterium]|nr:MAG: DUF2155 domain-containing protein [Rhodospirillales bacterium]
MSMLRSAFVGAVLSGALVAPVFVAAQTREAPAGATTPPEPPPPPPRPPVSGTGAATLQLPPLEAFKPLQVSPAAPAGARRAALMQGLDKVTTRTRRFPVAIGATVVFGTLRITASECMVNVPEAAPEAAAFVTIVDTRPGQPEQRLFSGWMFASAPALSALDNSVYDVWVVACATDAQAPAPSSTR